MKSSLDRYLYAIRMLKERYHCVRAVDAAHFLGFSKASVSIALRQMREQGLIEVEPDGNICFTAEGKKRADHLTARVVFFHQILTGAGVEPSLALKDAVSFSWEMSETSYEAFRKLAAASAET
ncbi:MAG: MarR family transcriptional regulator [Clostridia bacterium]|nr:MarR family transcriptional regulator [Clostridia bacterium]